MTRPSDPTTGVRRWDGGAWHDDSDRVAAEEPLQLRLNGEDLSIVMRTPGADLELALGLLYAERVIAEIADVGHVLASAEAGEQEARLDVRPDLLESNVVDLHLHVARRLPQRSFLASSACGVCGATTVESLAVDVEPVARGLDLDPAGVTSLPGRLREAQSVFDRTGGLHAAGAFNAAGELLVAREDIGRHNAVDKVVGRLLLQGRLPASGLLLAVSGRAGYEVVQKAAVAGFEALVAVGAASSLAVAVAERFGLTLVGFVRGDRFNVYAHSSRFH
jgi:FdhD protein